MGSFFKKFSVVVLLALALYFVSHGDVPYYLAEKLSLGKWARFDPIIVRIAGENDVDPALLKAVIWQESRFGPEKIGTSGERGLMQVTEAAAADWSKATGAKDFQPEQLLNPETNISVGAWYLKRALDHYQGKDQPLSFALTEYNAGRTRVKRWTGQPATGNPPMRAEEMKQKSFESTRDYVESIEHRYEYYQKAGWQ